MSWEDPALARGGYVVLKVAGTSHRLDALQSNAFEPGAEVALIPEPQNTHDPNAIAVWNMTGEQQVGYVPREHAPEIGRRLTSESLRVPCAYGNGATGITAAAVFAF